MIIEIKLDTSNAAFEDYVDELEDVLHAAAVMAKHSNVDLMGVSVKATTNFLYDSNGNKCGTVSTKRK